MLTPLELEAPLLRFAAGVGENGPVSATSALTCIFGIASVLLFVGTLAAIPWLVRRMPVDYFFAPPPPESLPKRILRNILGGALILAGIAMLFLPGQGILTILVGLSAIDLPLKRRLIHRLLRQPTLRAAVQRIRTSGGKPPLMV